MSEPPATTPLGQKALDIDHIAIAVPDLERSVTFFSTVLGFQVTERRETKGRKSGMVSAVLKAGQITVVLLQGTSPESQVSRYIEHYGPGVQHVAIGVRDLPRLADGLRAAGLDFDTGVIHGAGLLQIFTHRDPGSGMMFEFIEHTEATGDFSDQSVQSLFEQLEEKDAF